MKCLKMIALSAISSLFATSANGAILFSDNFSGYGLGTGQTALGLGWTVPSNSVDVYQQSTLELPASPGGFRAGFISAPSTAANGKFIDLAGTDNDSDSRGTLRTTAVVNGTSKILSFDLAGNNRFNNGTGDTVEVRVGGTLVGTYTPVWDSIFTNISVNILDSVNGALEFKMTGQAPTAIASGNFGAKIGPMLDNVVVNGEPNVIPEPSSALIALGLVSLLAVRNRKFFK